MGRTSRKWHRKKILSITDIAENEEDNLMHLKFYLTKNCSSVDNLDPFNFLTTGRGLKTSKDINVNDILIKIPYEILITTSTISESSVRNLFSTPTHYSPQCLLSVFVAYESHLSNVSKWYHYINSLPQVLTNTDFCTRREKNLLPSFIMDYVFAFHKVQNDYQLLIRSINSLSPCRQICSHCNLHFNKIITFEKYKWAYYIVNTRAVYIDAVHIDDNQSFSVNIKHPNNLALAPFLDLFNHDIHCTTQAAVISDENGCKFYQIATSKPFHSGSQVFINYGAHNSLKLYTDYGFFIPNNPLDEIYFDISDIEACFSVPKIKLDFIISNYLYKNMAFTRGGLNYNAISALFVINTKLHSRDHWSSKIYGNSLTSEDIANIHVVAKEIINLKKEKLIDHLTNMKTIKHCTQSYRIAIGLAEEYITILTASYNSCCIFRKS